MRTLARRGAPAARESVLPEALAGYALLRLPAALDVLGSLLGCNGPGHHLFLQQRELVAVS